MSKQSIEHESFQFDVEMITHMNSKKNDVERYYIEVPKKYRTLLKKRYPNLHQPFTIIIKPLGS
jgi:hypothetical protein